MSERTHARAQKCAARPVSKPHDRHENEAEHAAEIVARGGSVAGWSFSPVSSTVQRQDDGKPKSDDEKKKEALSKAGEALLETPQGKALKEKVLADPVVKTVKDAATSTPGLIVGGAAVAGGVGALAATHKPLPFQPPAIPLDKITPGLSAQVKIEGPVDRPTFVGLTITYKEQGPKSKKQSEGDRIAADVARLKAQQDMFKPATQKAAEKAEEDELVQAWIRSQSGLVIPLKGTPQPVVPSDAPKKDEEQKPVQPAPASPSAQTPTVANVDAAFATPGRPLDARIRQRMETRFGYDFSSVRVHDDAGAAATAASVSAAAFTVGEDIAFGIGRYSPSSAEGQRLLAHELAHVVQQSRSPRAARGASPVQRKVIVNAKELTAKERAAFLAKHKWADATLAKAVLDDMADAGDPFDFTDEAELTTELVKRVSTTTRLEQSQSGTKVASGYEIAFGYPFTAPAALYGPRVNYAARDLWRPAPPDNYAVRNDKKKNAQLLALPRHQRYTVYGDMNSSYSWVLTDKGKADTYDAIVLLFKVQPAHKRTLLHCDYLISIVNFRSLADSLGKAEFNKRIKAFGADKIKLRYDAFTDLHPLVVEAIVGGKGTTKTVPGLASTQRVAPTSEADFVIGDHVVFFNHLAYDLINRNIGNAWRLENAVLISRSAKGGDVFLGHGSGRKTTKQMRAKLAEEFNDVAKIAIALTKRAASKDTKISAKAQADLASRFPALVKKADGWHIVGKAGLCTTKDVDEKLREIKGDEVLGPRNPCDATKMYPVERPIESAKGKP
jgi:Domain of unknown function (DUF4157)